MKQANRDRRIREILKNTDFNKIHTAMVALNWEWVPVGAAPTTKQLKETAVQLLLEVADKKPGDFISTGGFKATRVKKGLALAFQLEEWDTSMV